MGFIGLEIITLITEKSRLTDVILGIENKLYIFKANNQQGYQMARVNFELPENQLFTTELQVRIDDINYGGHLGHDTVFTITHEARVRFFKNHGFSEKDIDGVGIVMADAAAIYKSETFYGDSLVIHVYAGAYSRHGCDLYYLLLNKETKKEIARVKTGIVFFDYKDRKVARMPEMFRRVLETAGSATE